VTQDQAQRDKELSLLQHLGELRDRLMVASFAVLITTIIAFFFAKDIILALEQPAHLGKPLQIISPTEGFTTYMRVALFSGIALAIVYTFFGTAVLSSQLSPEPGMVRTLETLAEALAGNPARYHALTERASWFLGTLPVVSYTLVLFALLMLLRPVLAPRAAAADTERVHNLLKTWGCNHISHLAVHGAPRPSPA